MIEKQEAPGDLERVRAFLNTWRIPNDTRVPTDLLQSQEGRDLLIANAFPQVSELSDLEATCQLRSDLRAALGTNEIVIFNTWLKSYPIHIVLDQDAAGVPVVSYQPSLKADELCSVILSLVVKAIAEGTWMRLKTCPDCQWVFYDSTKNGSKVWCGMLANGPQGRACGSISKVRNWRERQKVKSVPG